MSRTARKEDDGGGERTTTVVSHRGWIGQGSV
ncbi:hypothetical protein A2U01_0074369, partial [Trifolium medium]|nr:hypothetical protein [Trifolium medium]